MTKEINKDQMDALCTASYQLLQTMGNIYGSDPAYEMFQKLEEVLGPEVKSNLFLKMLESEYDQSSVDFSFPLAHGFSGVINVIKAAREFSAGDKIGQRLGLKEAKDSVDNARYGGRGSLYFSNQHNRASFISVLTREGGKVL